MVNLEINTHTHAIHTCTKSVSLSTTKNINMIKNNEDSLIFLRWCNKLLKVIFSVNLAFKTHASYYGTISHSQTIHVTLTPASHE